MIERIVHLRDCGVFRDFSWPNDLHDFSRYNLIYGWNGTGKTTISRVLRSLERREVPPNGRVQLRIDGRALEGDEFPSSTLPVRVFNRGFVQQTVFPVGGGDVPPIFVLGEKSVEKQKEIESLKAGRGRKEGELNAARAKKQQSERDLDRHCIDRAKVIKDTLQKTGSAYNNYNKADYQRQAQKMATDGDAAAHRLGDSQRQRFLAQHQATPKPKVSEVSYRFPDLQGLADRVGALLRRTVVSSAIQALKDDAALAEWVRHGLGLHKGRHSDRCLFCEQPLPEGRLANLEAHFNAEYEKFLQAVEDQVRALESARKQAAEVRAPNRAELYDDLTTEYDAAEQAFRQALDAVQAFLGELIKALNEKKTQPFRASSLAVSVPTIDAAVTDRLNNVIRRHNQACDDFDRRVSEARDRLALDMIAERLDEFVRLNDAVQTASAEIGRIENEIARISDRIEQLERDIKEHQRPAEELNKDLKHYLGHGELQMTIKDTGYSITRNGVPAAMLSEGEISAIALLYFLKSLEDRDFDLSNGVVVMDDPVCSLDQNWMFGAFGYIRARTEAAGQLIILTHNFLFFRQVRQWFRNLRGEEKRKWRLFMLDCACDDAGRNARIRRADPLLENYDSEYHYLFSEVYRLANGPQPSSVEAYYCAPSIARRVLEMFLAFRVPDMRADGSLWQRMLEAVRNGFDQAKLSRIYRFVQMHLHRTAIGAPDEDETLLGEARAVLNDVIDFMTTADRDHTTRMIAKVSAGDNAPPT